MKRTKLYVIALAVLAMSLIVWQRNTVVQNEDTDLLLPGLSENLARLETIEIRSGDEVISLELKEGRWLIVEKDAYPADFSMLSALTDSLAKARLLEKKTARAKNFNLLDVNDIEADGSKSHLVSGVAGDYSFSMLIGKAAIGRTGQFVRDPGEQQVWLTNNNIEVNGAVSAWLDPIILNVEASKILRIEQIDGAGEHQFTIEREGDKFMLVDLPDDRELKYATVVNEVAGSLSRVSLVDAQLHDPERWISGTSSIFHLADSVTITVRAVDVADEKWLHIEAESTNETLESGDLADLNLSYLKRWDYKVAKYTFDDFVKRREDLLDDVKMAEAEVRAE